MGFMLEIQVWDSFWGNRFGITFWDSGLRFRLWIQVRD